MRITVVSSCILISIILVSCGDRTNAPSAIISAEINSNIVKFRADVTGVDQYEWDFGDGSEKSVLPDPEHVYIKFGQEYTVLLRVTGPGGVSEITYIVVIPSANKMQSLTGGEAQADGKKWRLKDGESIRIVKPDNSFALITEWQAPSVLAAGFTGIFQNEFRFFSNGDYSISLTTIGIPAGLQYCLSKGILNNPPSGAAAEKGLTLVAGSSIPANLSYGLNESKDLTINATDGIHPVSVTFTDATTITFSRGGFLGFQDWITECLITQLSESEMSIALFISDIPSGSPMAGKANKALLMKFIAVN